jgi:hypothetical protein
MKADLESVFTRLRELLAGHSAGFTISEDTSTKYSLQAPVGAATLRAWRGKAKASAIPVAWVQIGKGYVSYHLMGVYGAPRLMDKYSNELKARMQGKSCFNFKRIDENLFGELSCLTADSLAAMKRGEVIS